MWFPKPRYLLTFYLLISFVPTAKALAFDPGLSPLKESVAYQQFRMRPMSELSKLLFLIDRFKDAHIQIVYDGHFYDPQFTARVAKWFVSRNYRGEDVPEFVMKWCNKSVYLGDLIWVKDSHGDVRLAREVLLGELKMLEQICEKEPEVVLPSK